MDLQLENIQLKKQLFHTQAQLLQYLLKEVVEEERVYLESNNKEETA
jgi:hypothetical protein